MADALEEVRREVDGELEGYVRQGAGSYEALSVFHGVIAAAGSAAEARRVVHARGLPALAERWFWWSRAARSWKVVIPQEAHPGTVRVVLGYYALPGVPTAVITAHDLAQGDILTLQRPDAPIDGYFE